MILILLKDEFRKFDGSMKQCNEIELHRGISRYLGMSKSGALIGFHCHKMRCSLTTGPSLTRWHRVFLVEDDFVTI